jgi:hypothetical protein
MAERLQILVQVEPEAIPVVEALQRLSVNIGSVAADKLDANAPPDARLLCVSVADRAEVDRLAVNLRRELADHRLLACLALPMPLGTWLVVFTDIAALDLA